MEGNELVDAAHDDVIYNTVCLPPTAVNPGTRYPVCTDGSRACPPEDCGGACGYAELLEIIQDPSHEVYLDRL